MSHSIPLIFQEEKSRQASESDLLIWRSRAVDFLSLGDIAESLTELLSFSLTPEQSVIFPIAHSQSHHERINAH